MPLVPEIQEARERGELASMYTRNRIRFLMRTHSSFHPHSPTHTLQRWLRCEKCGNDGPRDCASARHILANGMWHASFARAMDAQKYVKEAGVRQAWEAVQREVVAARARAQAGRMISEAQRRAAQERLDRAETGLETVLVKPRMDEARRVEAKRRSAAARRDAAYQAAIKRSRPAVGE